MEDTDKAKVDAAVAAHGQWLLHLRSAVEHGSSEFSPDVVKTDNSCAFGKWLYGDFPRDLRGTPAFEELRTLHAKFHQEAGTILKLAVEGRKSEASQLLLSSSPFMSLSSSLVMKLRALRRS